jgi:outer membrane cobalamin receptor
MVKNYVKPADPEWKYAVLDGKVTRTVLSRQSMKGEVFFGMNNIFDREYRTIKNYPMPPKEIYGGVAVQF